MILTENARIRLRTMRKSDLDELYALLSDEAVMRWLEPPYTRAQAETFLAMRSITIMTNAAGSLAGCSDRLSGTRAMQAR